MADLFAIRGDNASPYDSLSRAKAILRESTERALLERRRKEKQHGLQSSMLEYTEHARRVRQAHLELQARGGAGDRRPRVANQLGAALAHKPRKGRSPLRASDGELRRLYGDLAPSDRKAIEDRYLPEILQPAKSDAPPRNSPAKQRGEGADYWDVVTRDGTVKRIVILRTDDRLTHPRHGEAQRMAGTTARRDSYEQNSGGLVSHRSDGSLHERNRDPVPEPVSKLDKSYPGGDSIGAGQHTFHPGILPRPHPANNKPSGQKQTIKIEVSLPRMEMETPSPDPTETEPDKTEEAVLPRIKSSVCLQHGFDIARCKKCRNDSHARTKHSETLRRNENGPHPILNPMRVSTHTYPIQKPKLAQVIATTEPVQSQGSVDRGESQISRPEMTQSSLGLGDDLAYQRAFTVNTSVQSLPTRMEGILKNAMSSARSEPAGSTVQSPARGADPVPSADASRQAVGLACRHGHMALSCHTCRTVDEIQRRLRAAKDFRRDARQSLLRDLQAGKAISRSSRWEGNAGQPRLLPHHLKEMWARRKKSRITERLRKPTGTKHSLERAAKRLDASAERPGANSILKASTESLGHKKSVRFSEDDVYHPMTGYHPIRDTGNIVSAS